MAENIDYSRNDRLSRFIRSKSKIFKKTSQAKPGAFLPPPDKKLSVFHTEKIKERQIWQLADQHLIYDKCIQFRADITVISVEKADLSIDWNYQPNYHVDIIGWPEGKEEQKLRAADLASRSKLKNR